MIPASVIVQEDLGGMHTRYMNDAELVNAPSVHAYRRGIYILIMLRAGVLFPRLDKVGDSRQNYQVAELCKPDNVHTVAPEHMMMKMSPGQRRVEGSSVDFRDEIYAHMYKSGASEPTGAMDFDIVVSSHGRKSGIPGLSRVVVEPWQKIGKVRFTEAICSYNGDHVIQFHHPGWRTDRNDPSTNVRVEEIRVHR